MTSLFGEFLHAEAYVKLMGMVDDKKGMERRIEMVILTALFQNKRRLFIPIGLTCIVILGGVLLTSGLAREVPLQESGDNLFRIHAFPEVYTPAMSITPGIRLVAEYHGPIGRVRYETDFGALQTWDMDTGIVTAVGKSVELAYGTPVYWTPAGDFTSPSTADLIPVEVTILDSKNKPAAKKRVNITLDGSHVYTVQLSPDIVFGGPGEDI